MTSDTFDKKPEDESRRDFLVLTTGNKSEMTTGYATLYGDMAGGFAVIKDLAKTEVFKLARWRNANDPYGTGQHPIPERIITRAAIAETRKGSRSLRILTSPPDAKAFPSDKGFIPCKTLRSLARRIARFTS